MKPVNNTPTFLGMPLPAADEYVGLLRDRFGGDLAKLPDGREALGVMVDDKILVFSVDSAPNVAGGQPMLFLNGCRSPGQPPVEVSVVQPIDLYLFTWSTDVVALHAYEYEQDGSLSLTFATRAGEELIARVAPPKIENGMLIPSRIKEVDPA